HRGEEIQAGLRLVRASERELRRAGGARIAKGVAGMSGALRGIRVVELSTMIAAPRAGMNLADLGANVITVERRDGGAPFSAYSDVTYRDQYVSCSRDKRSIADDQQAERGREVLARLIGGADVLPENFRPGVLVRVQI